MMIVVKRGNRAPKPSLIFLAACITVAYVHIADAATAYPAKPVRVIIPYSPGGGADNLARALQPALGAALGQSLVLDNRPGASGIVGSEMTVRAAPDGYTVALMTTTYTVIPAMMKKMPYDVVKDIAGVSLAATQPNVLVVHPAVAAKSVQELIALAKAKPGALSYSSGGSGSAPHLGGALLQMATGIKLIHVPYKGSGPGVIAVLAGQVTMMLVGPLSVEQFVVAGRLRVLATADKKRSAVFPDTPTLAEQGISGVESGTWYGFVAPAKTPMAIRDAFHAAVLKAMAVPETKNRLRAQGMEIIGGGPQEFDQFLRDETAKWRKLVETAGITAE